MDLVRLSFPHNHNMIQRLTAVVHLLSELLRCLWVPVYSSRFVSDEVPELVDPMPKVGTDRLPVYQASTRLVQCTQGFAKSGDMKWTSVKVNTVAASSRQSRLRARQPVGPQIQCEGKQLRYNRHHPCLRDTHRSPHPTTDYYIWYCCH